MKIRPSPKTRSQMFPCQMPPVTALLNFSKNKMANQTKGSSPIWKPWAQVTKTGRSLNIPKTTMQWSGQFPLRSLKDRNVSKSYKELVSAQKQHRP